MIKLVGEKLQQYDLNRTVELIPKAGREVEEVLFYKNGPDPLCVAYRDVNGSIIADIPNILLKSFGTLNVEVHLVDSGGHPISENTSFYVSRREMPEDYEYTETPTLELGSGGGGVTSWNDLEDKPEGGYGYTSAEVGEILPTTELEPYDGSFMTALVSPVNITVGEEYVISWNGTEYSCVAQDLSALDPGAIGLGDLTSGGFTGNSEPFMMMFMEESNTQLIRAVPLDGSTEVTISITGQIVTDHKIDKKYLPGVNAFNLTMMGLPTIGSTEVSCTVDTTELLRALADGIVSLYASANLVFDDNSMLNDFYFTVLATVDYEKTTAYICQPITPNNTLYIRVEDGKITAQMIHNS